VKYARYDKKQPYGYAPGVFPSIELMDARPEVARALIYDPKGMENEGLRRLLARCAHDGIPVEEAPHAVERALGKGNAYCALAFDKYEDTLAAQRDHVVLCGIGDMGNLGTIVRTCLGFGIQDIALIRPCVDCFDPRVVRASMGALFRARVCYYDDYDAYANFAGERESYFFRLHNARPVGEVSRGNGPASFVFGNEGSGLLGKLLAMETGVVIPHEASIDSLNLSVAVGIGLYALARRT
jgi:TrmH family RNA methyltransferase